MEYLRFIGLLFTILIFNLFLCCAFDKKSGLMLPVTFILLAFIQFIAALFGRLMYFKYVLVVCYIGIIIYLVYTNKRKHIEIKNIFKISTIVFSIIFVYLFILLKNGVYSCIDDFYYYGPVVRDALMNDTLYTSNGFITAVPGYPPFIPLLNIFFNKFLGGNKDGYSILAVCSFSLSFFMFIFDKYEIKLEKHTIVKSIITTIAVLSILLSIQVNTHVPNQFIFNSANYDWVISITLAFMIYRSIDCLDDKKDFIILGIVSTAFIEYKRITIPLYIMVICVVLLKLAIDKKLKRNIINCLLFLVVLPMLLIIFRIHYQNLFMPSTIGVSIGEVVKSIDVVNDYKIQVFSKFLTALIFEPVLNKPFKLSFVAIIIIESLLMLIIYKLKSNKNWFVALIFLIGAIGYSYCIVHTMANSMTVHEGLTLAAYGRYMECYAYFGLVLLFFIVFDYLSNTYAVLLCGCIGYILLIEPQSLNTININRQWYRKNERQKISTWLEQIYAPMPETVRMSVLSNNDMECFYMVRYISYKKCNNIDYVAIPDDCNLQDFKKIITKNEYILIGYYSEKTEELWKQVTDTPLLNSTIYKVETKDGAINITIEECLDD